MLENAEAVKTFLQIELEKRMLPERGNCIYLLVESDIEQIALKLWGSLPPRVMSEAEDIDWVWQKLADRLCVDPKED